MSDDKQPKQPEQATQEGPRMPSCVRPYLVTIRAIVIDHDFTVGGGTVTPESWDLQALYEEIDRAGGLIDVEAVELVPKVQL